MEVLQRTANRGSISTGSYEIENSCKFEADNREYLRWTNFSNQASSARKKKFTFSAWVKRTELGGNQQVFISTAQNGYLTFEANNQLTWIQQYGGSQLVINTTRVFRDTSAFYHIMVVVDTAQGTEADRTKIYVNGVQETVFDSAAYPSQNAEASNLFEQHLIVGEWGGTSLGFCGYMADYYFLSEIAASPTDLGEFDEDSGIWKPKAYDGTISSPSHFLEFKDGSDLGTATSGLDSDYQNNLTAADQATDTPTNNFCTFNAVNMSGSSAKLAEGATFTASTANGAFTTYGTMAPSSGKWWWEGKIQVFESGSTYACIGATTNLAGLPSVSAQLSGGHVIKLAKNQKWVLNSTGYTYGATYADADIINVGLDLDNRKFYTYKNGTIDDANGIDISSSTFDGFGSQWMPLVITYGSGGASSYEINFGGYRTYGIGSPQSDGNGYGTFEYAPPSGYYALCTKNLAEFG